MSTNVFPDLRVETFTGARRAVTVEALMSADTGFWDPDIADPPPVCGSDAACAENPPPEN